MSADFIRGCYYSSWAVYRAEPHKFTPEQIPLDLCTHIFYAFASLNAVTFEAQPFDQWADIDLKGYERFTGLKKKKQGLKTLLSFGGWTMSQSGVFERMAATPATRKVFINSAWALVNKYGFDGIDMDWEYPNAANKDNFSALMRELKGASNGKLVTAAVAAATPKIEAGYDAASLSRSVDFLNIMTYDYHGTWDREVGHVAAYSETIESVIAWESIGFPKWKMALGLAIYGRGWATADCRANATGDPAPAQPYSQLPGHAFYFELMNMGGSVIQSAEGPYLQAAVAGQKVCYSYDDSTAIIKKMKFVKEQGLAGAFTWTADTDNNGFDLHVAMNQGLKGRGSAPRKGTGQTKEQGHKGAKAKEHGSHTHAEGHNSGSGAGTGEGTSGGGHVTCTTGQLRANADKHYYDECVHGRWMKRPCPPGTVFDAATNTFAHA